MHDPNHIVDIAAVRQCAKKEAPKTSERQARSASAAASAPPRRHSTKAMGKKRNGVANKLKGPVKWQKGSKEGRKILQAKTDKKQARRDQRDDADGTTAEFERIQAQAKAELAREFEEKLTGKSVVGLGRSPAAAGGSEAESLVALTVAIKRYLSSDAGWARLREWMLPRLRRCCDGDDAAGIIAQYTTDLLRAKPAADWPAVLARELQTFLRGEGDADAIAAETLAAICDGSIAAAPAVTPGRGGAAAPQRAITKKKTGKKKKKKTTVWAVSTDPDSGKEYWCEHYLFDHT